MPESFYDNEWAAPATEMEELKRPLSYQRLIKLMDVIRNEDSIRPGSVPYTIMFALRETEKGEKR
jgi:hypothetical protein